MATSPKPDYLTIFEVLDRHKVDFIVVVGVSAVLHEAPIATWDVDIVHRCTEAMLPMPSACVRFSGTIT